MADLLDQVVLVDLEWTCWEDEQPPPGQQNEIIEIGVCLLDINKLTRTRRENILVRPQRSTLSEFCAKLTHLSQKQLEEKGIPFDEACQKLRERYHSDQRTCAGYSDSDRERMKEQCQAFEVAYPFGETYLNVENLVNLALNQPNKIDLMEAMELLHLPFEGEHHRAKADSWNTAAILAELLQRCR